MPMKIRAETTILAQGEQPRTISTPPLCAKAQAMNVDERRAIVPTNLRDVQLRRRPGNGVVAWNASEKRSPEFSDCAHLLPHMAADNSAQGCVEILRFRICAALHKCARTGIG